MMSAAPADILSGPTARHAVGWLALGDDGRSASAVGNPGSCSSRFGRTCAYASTSVWMTSGRTLFFIQVDVVAISPSTSNWFE